MLHKLTQKYISKSEGLSWASYFWLQMLWPTPSTLWALWWVSASCFLFWSFSTLQTASRKPDSFLASSKCVRSSKFNEIFIIIVFVIFSIDAWTHCVFLLLRLWRRTFCWLWSSCWRSCRVNRWCVCSSSSGTSWTSSGMHCRVYKDAAAFEPNNVDVGLQWCTNRSAYQTSTLLC